MRMPFGMNVDIKAHSRTSFYEDSDADVAKQFEQVLGFINRCRPSKFVRAFTFLVTEFDLLLQKNFQIANLGYCYWLWWGWCPWYLHRPP